MLVESLKGSRGILGLQGAAHFEPLLINASRSRERMFLAVRRTMKHTRTPEYFLHLVHLYGPDLLCYFGFLHLTQHFASEP